MPEEYQKRTEASLLTALVSAGIATLTCYPLDTLRRQMQMRGTPYKTVLDAFPGTLILSVAVIETLLLKKVGKGRRGGLGVWGVEVGGGV